MKGESNGREGKREESGKRREIEGEGEGREVRRRI